MNIFVSIESIPDFSFKKVKYYTVRFEGNENSEFIDFLNRLESETEYTDDLDNLFEWLQKIGEEYGAQERFFRDEQNAHALPPPYKQQKLEFLEVESIRLYCLRLNESVVLLFNGGIKTTQKAQDCPNVSLHFHNATKLASQIDEYFQSKELCWNPDYTDIIFDDNLRLEL